MSSPGVPSSALSRRQKRMGPAPFASFEDLSDELDSPEDKNTASSVVRLPGIREDATPQSPPPNEETSPEFIYTGISLVGASATPPSTAMSSLSTPRGSETSTGLLSLQTPSTPRIDISRASSSSHHEDSRDSTPERELFEGHNATGTKLGLGFKEEGTLDLRSSTEELDFQDPQARIKSKPRTQSPFKQDDSHLSHQRKDSQSSEIGLLSISGRTSRLSSVGSQGSAHSRISNASHLSVLSGFSGLSRSPSPHKMLLETSFCGTKLPTSELQSVEQQGSRVESEVLEKVLLSRKHDPTQAILAEGISMDNQRSNTISKVPKCTPEKPVRKSEKIMQNVISDITITVEKPSMKTNNATNLPRKIISESGIEYIYIPLKGPLPPDNTNEIPSKIKTKNIKSASMPSKSVKNKELDNSKHKKKSESTSPISERQSEPTEYIRIKLKPDHLYGDDKQSACVYEVQKPDSLNLNDTNKKTSQNFPQIVQKENRTDISSNIRHSENQVKSLSNTPSASPKLSRHGFLKESNMGSKTPSPSLSRKSSFASLFKSKETIVSPESPTVPSFKRKNTLTGIFRDASGNIRERNRSRSKSRDRDKSSVMSVAPTSTESIDSKSKQKSVFSIFKPKKTNAKCRSDMDIASPETLTNLEGITNVEFTFNTDNNLPNKNHKNKFREIPLEGDSIRIPLHTPTQYEDRTILQDVISSSQDSQETVIETTSKYTDAIVETVPKDVENGVKVTAAKTGNSNRQSSTSSENIVFSTKLGSNNEIFTTKLPKEKQTKNYVTGTSNIANENIIEIEHITKTLPNIENVQVSAESAATSVTMDVIKNNIRKEETFVLNENLNIKSCSMRRLNTNTNQAEERNKSEIEKPEDDHQSSESERDSEVDYSKNEKDIENNTEPVEPERKGLVLQQDSFEDELPYVPTTLPLERSVAVPIVPVKQRGTFEMKTCPIERPRSTTPINPGCLEDYCDEIMSSLNVDNITKSIEKLKISLPREDSTEKACKLKSPRRTASNTNWFEFAEKGITSQRHSPPSQEFELAPPPLPPKAAQKEWINFEEIPERRKPPKRIQTIPSRGNIEISEAIIQENVVYSYVNPEDCKCECHEINARERDRQSQRREEALPVQEDEVPLLDDDVVEEGKSIATLVDRIKLDVTTSDRISIVSDSSVDLSASAEHTDVNSAESLLRTPFTTDLSISSNRSSIISQEEPQSPDSGSPNAFPNTL